VRSSPLVFVILMCVCLCWWWQSERATALDQTVVAKKYVLTPSIFVHVCVVLRWWHKCMSDMGNANQLAMVKQYMILEEMQAGYSGQISDGRMFKQIVLTPEIINDRCGRRLTLRAACCRSRAGGGNCVL